jgi:2'-5' RNA ligase
VEALETAPLGPRFAVVLGGLGAFPRPRRAGVLWVGVDEGAAELKRVAALVEEAARQAGFPAEKKPFSPHLTIARLHPARDLEETIAAAPALRRADGGAGDRPLPQPPGRGSAALRGHRAIWALAVPPW